MGLVNLEVTQSGTECETLHENSTLFLLSYDAHSKIPIKKIPVVYDYAHINIPSRIPVKTYASSQCENFGALVV